MREHPMIAAGYEAGRLNGAEHRHLELLGQRNLGAYHIGEDRHDDLHAVHMDDLAHGGHRALGIALAVFQDQRKRMAIDTTCGIDVLHSDFDRRYQESGPRHPAGH